MDVLKEGAFTKLALKPVFALSPGYAHLPDGLKLVYTMVALLSEGEYNVPTPNWDLEPKNLRSLRTQLPAISRALLED